MEKPDDKEIARMLGNPEGELGKQVAEKMNESNYNIIRWTIDRLSINDGEAILEIGFGNGSHICEVLQKGEGLSYTGVDISDTMIKEATQRNEAMVKSGKIALHNASVENLPFPADSFDKIFTVNTLYFWKDPEAYSKEIVRVLKPGGVFCLAIKSKSFMKELPFVQHGFTLYDQEEAIALLAASGFKILAANYRQEAPIDYMGTVLVPDAIIVAASK